MADKNGIAISRYVGPKCICEVGSLAQKVIYHQFTFRLQTTVDLELEDSLAAAKAPIALNTLQASSSSKLRVSGFRI